MAQTHHYLTNMGMLVRLTPRQMRRFLIAKSADHDATPEHHGTPIGTVTDVTDWTPDDAAERLNAG